MKFLYLLFFTAITAHASPVALESGQEGHGGDIAVAQFIQQTDFLLNDLAKIEPAQLPNANFISELVAATQHTKIYSTDLPLTLNGVEVDAVNFPDMNNPRIIISRNRWLDTRVHFSWRRLLILHEYLSIIGHQDGRYEISRPLIEQLYPNNLIY